MKILFLFFVIADAFAQAQASQEMQLSNRIEARSVQGKVSFLKCRLAKCISLGKDSGYTKTEISKKFPATTPAVGWLVEGKEDVVFALLGGNSESGDQLRKSAVCKVRPDINGPLEKAKKSQLDESAYTFISDDLEKMGCVVFEGVKIKDVEKEVVAGLSKT